VINCWCGDVAEWFYNPAAAATAVISFWHKDQGGTTTPMNGLCQKHRPLYEIKEIRAAQYGPPKPYCESCRGIWGEVVAPDDCLRGHKNVAAKHA
jgi:hypothetical protein